ncbi:MAG: DNA alkylation repair protein [Oscillospiraceae bacterium]
MMTNREIIQILEDLAEPGYQRFASSLIPGETQLMGVRLPQLRKLAKRLARENWQGYLIQEWGTSFEEVLLQGMILGYAKGTWEQRLQAVTAYLPQIRNWSIVTVCSSLKMPKENPQGFGSIFSSADAQEEFTVRFAVVMLLNYCSPEYYSRCCLPGRRPPSGVLCQNGRGLGTVPVLLFLSAGNNGLFCRFQPGQGNPLQGLMQNNRIPFHNLSAA